MTSPSILLFAGSTRQGSFNHHLALVAQKRLMEQGVKADVISLANYPMPLYNGDIEDNEGVPETALALGQKICDYPGVFIASPEYNASFTPLLKNTIDWLSRLKPDQTGGQSVFRDRVFALGGATPGSLGTIRGMMAIRLVLTVGVGAHVIPQQFGLPNAFEILDKDHLLIKDEKLAGMLDNTLQGLVKAAGQVEHNG
jgi:chromate reductase